MPTAMKISEDQLARWTRPAFGNEDEKAATTEAMIREAINNHALLKTLRIRVFAKGSYRNNTNVRRDSDVDVAVEYQGIIHSEYGTADRAEVWKAQRLEPYNGAFSIEPGRMDIAAFKNAVGEALEQTFGVSAVTRHNKVFTVRESSRFLAADVVPATTYRKYSSPTSFRQGIRLHPDRPVAHWVINYPDQHYENGVAKNKATSKRFKSVVRILKNLENQMVRDGTSPEVASYLIECLVYNAPDEKFINASTWSAQVREVLFHAWDDTNEEECEKRWLEVNRYKYLFHSHQKWNRSDARQFVHAAWQYVKDS